MKKTMTTTTEKNKKKTNPGGGGGGSTSTNLSSPPGLDRISELPVEILHRILGLLEMDELLIRTSLVSTKWRNLWKSVSNLKFPSAAATSGRRRKNDGGGGDIRTNDVEKYQNFVDHVLRLRDSEASKIRIFRYCWPWGMHNSREGGSLELVHNFIVSAVVNQGAQEIEILLGLHSGQSRGNTNNMIIIHLNPSIFTTRELRKFTFQVLINRHYQIQFPRSMCSCATTQLTHLNLYFIRLPEGDDATAQLHLVCPVLETFQMSNCSSEHLKVLDISAPRLDTLFICNIDMRNADFDGLGGCRLEIRTPNLTFLHYYGLVYVDCFTENLPRLDFAILNFTKETTAGLVEKTTSFATKLLKGLTSAHSLRLEGFEVFSHDTLRDLLTPFTSLRNLKLVTSCKISSIHGMVHILNSCNSLKMLFWKVDEKCMVEGDDEHLMLPQCRLSHLMIVHIHSLHGHANEIEFVKFLLKNSVVLEDIKINTATDSPKISIEDNLRQFIEEEPSIRSIKLHIL